MTRRKGYDLAPIGGGPRVRVIDDVRTVVPQNAARTQAVADALSLVRRIAEREPLTRINWARDRLCRLCMAVIVDDTPSGDGHRETCAWLEAQRIVTALSDSGGPGRAES